MTNSEKIENWMSTPSLDFSKLGEVFSFLKQGLIESEDTAGIKKFIGITRQFLQKLIMELNERSVDTLPLNKLFGVLSTLLAEAGPSRFETSGKSDHQEILSEMKTLRGEIVQVFKIYFARKEFQDISSFVETEVLPLLEEAIIRPMPFRVIQAGKVADTLFRFTDRITNWKLQGLLERIYTLKYPRFGTSGVRGRLKIDFDELRAKRVTQAICDYIKEKLKSPSNTLVIGYDSRLYADRVAQWVTEVCLANGLTVHLANRDTPTPVLIYWGAEKLGAQNIAGIIICTASHNPVEWHGIKYSKPNGASAPTSVTDWIGSRANLLQTLEKTFEPVDLEVEREKGRVFPFDAIEDYCNWILSEEKGLNKQAIKDFFGDKKVILDEMHSASRGYLSRILGELGVEHRLVHGKIDRTLGDLAYASPEPPFINDCIAAVKKENAVLGLAVDTDSDRYGVIDQGGIYFRPNQILPMLADYLVRIKQYKGKIVRTQSTTRAMDAVAKDLDSTGRIVKPDPTEPPAYTKSIFYQVRVGKKEDLAGLPTYVVPVGIKYIAEVMEPDRNNFVVGGEESSGLTTRGHILDKDGIWACMLIMEMIAVQKKSVHELWKEFIQKYGEFHSDRIDVDATDEAKEKLIDFYLDAYKDLTPEQLDKKRIAGHKVAYLGGVRYDNLETILEDNTGARSYLILRASGTEPLNRIYTESHSEEKRYAIEQEALQKLEEFSAEVLRKVQGFWELVDTLTVTEPGRHLANLVKEIIGNLSKTLNEPDLLTGVIKELEKRAADKIRFIVEKRNKEVITKWLELLKGNDER
jgi:phosphomannomutase